MLGNQLVSYLLLAHVPGESLRDLLKKHPQLWIDHIGWITVEIASALALLHGAHHVHLALGPEAVLVDFAGDQAVPKVTLIDLGLAATLRATTDDRTYVEHWYPEVAHPNATAPELENPRPVGDGNGVAASTATDVYGLGLVLYELLAGTPPFPRPFIAQNALNSQSNARTPLPLRRKDVQPVADLALQMLHLNPKQRPADARAVVTTITGTEIGSPPAIRTRRWPTPERIFRVAVIVLTLAFTIAVVLSFGEFFV
jgi:serine/threonine-protein kinase